MLFDVDEPKAAPQKETKEEMWARVRKEWEPIETAGKAAIGAHAGVFEQFRCEMEIYFRAMQGDKTTHSRKPNISLRLIVAGEPVAKLIVLPGWSPYSKTLDCSYVRCELLTERDVETPKGPGKKWDEQIAVKIDDQGPSLCSYRRSVVDDLERVVSTIGDYLNDRSAVLARAHDHCSICGRPLTDELSRSRGIGPECIVKLPSILAVITDQSIVVPEASAS
jgi:hypothetical protein